MDHRERKLRKLLGAVREDYDAIFIDCPPSLEMLTLNGLIAADGILIPVQCEYYALEGLSDLMATLRSVKRKLTGGSIFPPRSPRRCAVTSPARSLPPPSPATSAWRRPPATVCPSRPMTAAAGARPPTGSLPRKWRKS